MRIVREVLVFGILLFAVSTALNYYRAPKLDNNTLPDFQVTLIDGSSFDTATLKGKPLLLHFWGTWCPVCSQEAGNIATLSQTYAVLTIAVNSRSDAEIREWMQEKGVDYPVLNDRDGRWAKRFKVDIYPTAFIYNSQGKLAFTETGYSTTAGLMARMKLAE